VLANVQPPTCSRQGISPWRVAAPRPDGTVFNTVRHVVVNDDVTVTDLIGRQLPVQGAAGTVAVLGLAAWQPGQPMPPVLVIEADCNRGKSHAVHTGMIRSLLLANPHLPMLHVSVRVTHAYDLHETVKKHYVTATGQPIPGVDVVLYKDGGGGGPTGIAAVAAAAVGGATATRATALLTVDTTELAAAIGEGHAALLTRRTLAAAEATLARAAAAQQGLVGQQVLFYARLRSRALGRRRRDAAGARLREAERGAEAALFALRRTRATPEQLQLAADELERAVDEASALGDGDGPGLLARADVERGAATARAARAALARRGAAAEALRAAAAPVDAAVARLLHTPQAALDALAARLAAALGEADAALVARADADEARALLDDARRALEARRAAVAALEAAVAQGHEAMGARRVAALRGCAPALATAIEAAAAARVDEGSVAAAHRALRAMGAVAALLEAFAPVAKGLKPALERHDAPYVRGCTPALHAAWAEADAAGVDAAVVAHERELLAQADALLARHDDAVAHLEAAERGTKAAVASRHTAQIDAAVRRLEAAVFEAREVHVPKELVLPAQVTLTQTRAARRSSALLARK